METSAIKTFEDKVKNISKIIFEKLKQIWKKISSNHYVQVYFNIFIISFVFFAIQTLGNNFMLPLSGDYELQTYAFNVNAYSKLLNFFKTGTFDFYDFSNVFGAGYMGTATFYSSFSPFFFLLLLFPFKYIFQGILFLLIIKYATGGFFFYILIKKCFHLKDRTAFIGGVIYAFSGWSLYFLWFHYSDVVALVPLLFIGIEYVLQKKKGWILTVGLFLLGITNYFFLFTFAIAGVLYALFRWLQIYANKQHTSKERWGVLLQGVLYFAVGVIMSGVILYPAYLAVLDSGRLGSVNILMNFLKHFFVNPTIVEGVTTLGPLKSFGAFFKKGNLQSLFDFVFKWQTINGTNTNFPAYILSEFFIMNLKCWGNAVFNGNDSATLNHLGGLYLTTPIALLLIPALFNAIKSKKPWTIVGCILVVAMPFIPFSFYLFHGFTAIYGRWELFIVVVALIFLLKTFDEIESVNSIVFVIGMIINIVLTFVALIKSSELSSLDTYYIKDGVFTLGERTIVYAFQIAYMVLFSFFFVLFRDKKWFNTATLVCIIGELAITTNLTIRVHGFDNGATHLGGQEKFQEEKKVIDLIQEDESFYRISNAMATRAYSNLPSTLSYNGTSTFNSIYTKGLDPFLTRGDVMYAGGWSMGYYEKRVYFDRFLGIKYYIVDKEDMNNDRFKDKNDQYNGRTSLFPNVQTYQANIPFGYSLAFSTKTFDVYKNDYFIELGFAYDDYISETAVGTTYEALYYDTLYSNYVILDSDVIKDVIEVYEGGNKVNDYNYRGSDFVYKGLTNFKIELSLRNDCYDKVCNSLSANDIERPLIDLSGSNPQKKLSDALKEYNTTSMRRRWESASFFGDELIFTPTTPLAPLANKDNPAYLDLDFRMGPNVLTTLYNGNKLIGQDAISTHNYSMGAGSERKNSRGFYVSEPVTQIVIEFLGDYEPAMFNLNNFYVTYSYLDTYKTSYDKLMENPVFDVVQSSDKFTFKTNYEKEKILVLNIPYDENWSLTKGSETVTIFSAQGGFIGLIAKPGLQSYTLVYTSPGLRLGAVLTGVGIIGFIGLALYYNRKQIIEFVRLSKAKPYEAELILDDTVKEEVEVQEKKRKKAVLLAEILRYLVAGGIATVFDMGVLAVFKNILPNGSLFLMIATALGFLVGLTTNYILSIFYVFKNGKKVDKDNPLKVKLVFVITSVIGLLLTLLLMFIGETLMGYYYLFVKAVVVVIVLVWNYVSKKIWIFKKDEVEIDVEEIKEN